MNFIIFANGDIPHPQINLPPGASIIAADGGARHCLKLGLSPQAVIGDFDSLSEAELTTLEASGTELVRHPVDKDEIDLELALDYALKQGATEITLYGLLGGRWDMSFANLLLLAAPRFAGIRLRCVEGDTEMFLLRGGHTLELRGHPGDTVSVIPLSAETRGVTYSGLAWPLENATLPFGTPRGMSNRLLTSEADVKLEKGIILIVVTHQVPGDQLGNQAFKIT